MIYKMLGTRVREVRKNKGYTQSELAEMIEYSVQHISHVETGSTKLSVELLVCIANALEVSLDELLRDSLKYSSMNIQVPIDASSIKEKNFILNIIKVLKEELVNFQK